MSCMAFALADAGGLIFQCSSTVAQAPESTCVCEGCCNRVACPQGSLCTQTSSSSSSSRGYLKMFHNFTWRSSKRLQVPRHLGLRLLTVVCTAAPVAAATLCRSSCVTCDQRPHIQACQRASTT